MNEKEIANELMTWLPKIGAGKALEYLPYRAAEEWHDIMDTMHLHQVIIDGRDIRFKQITLPDAPDGEEWNNPDNLTSDQVGIIEGWRLLLKSEIDPARGPIQGLEVWDLQDLSWIPGKPYPYSANCHDETYRIDAKKHPIGSLNKEEKDKDHRLYIQGKAADALFSKFSSLHFHDALEIVESIADGDIEHLKITY